MTCLLGLAKPKTLRSTRWPVQFEQGSVTNGRTSKKGPHDGSGGQIREWWPCKGAEGPVTRAGSLWIAWSLEKAPASYRAISGLSGPKPQKSQKRVKKESPGPSPPVPEVQKVRKESKTSQKWVKRVILTRFWLFLDFLDPWDRRVRETLFWLGFDSFGISGPKGPKWLCSWRGLSQMKPFWLHPSLFRFGCPGSRGPPKQKAMIIGLGQT